MVETIPWEGLIPPSLSDSRDELVVTYGYLCRRGARKFWRGGLERSDLEQVAAIGLIKATRRYDPTTRTPFEAYAWLMIVGELMHFVRDHERPIRVPRRMRSLEGRANAAQESLYGRLGREPNDEELANELGVLRATIAELRRSRELAVCTTLSDAEQIPQSDRGESAFEERFFVETSFRTLGETERRIIVGIYVLGLSQLELSRRLGISPKRVSRAHHAALGRLHRALA